MEQYDLRIKASHEDLARLKESLYEKVNEVYLQEDTELRMGQHGEPFLIAIVVALGGATLTREVLKTVRHWMDEREKEHRLDLVKMYLERDGESRNVTFEE